MSKSTQTEKRTVAELGWRDGTVEEFLELSPEESALVEIRLALSDFLRKKRRAAHLTQAALSVKIETDQARVARAESGSSSVSLDFIVRAALAAGATPQEIGKVLIESGAP